MATKDKFGKIDSKFFDQVIFKNLGAKRGAILVGPGTGVDASVLKTAIDQVLVCSTDPLSLIPRLGPRLSAWMSVNLIAADISTTGFKPQYAGFELNLPSSLSIAEISEYWTSLSKECSNLGIAIVTGHTGKFEGIDSTIIGSGFMVATGAANSFVTSRNVNVGDEVIMTKGAAISSTGILSRVFPRKLGRSLGKSEIRRAQDFFYKIPILEDALIAVQTGIGSGGVTGMHDVAEGGVLNAAFELAKSAGHGILIVEEDILVKDETIAVCDFFGIDPIKSLGEGSLLIASNPRHTQALLKELNAKGIDASVIGEIRGREFGTKISKKNGKIGSISLGGDPYWNAYYNAVRKKWN